MAQWLHKSVIQVAEGNASSTDTVNFTAAAAGNLLIAVAAGSVTSTTPTGWTLGASAVGSSGHYVWYKTAAASESSFSTTHNGTGYSTAYVVYEFPAGSTFVKGSGLNGVSSGSTNPTITGLTGTNLDFVTANQSYPYTTYNGTGVTWTSGIIEDVEIHAQHVSHDGYWLSIGYTSLDAAASYTGTPTFNDPNGTVASERLTFSVNVPLRAYPVATATATIVSGGGTSATTNVTVPAGVTKNHLGIAMIMDDGNYGDGAVASISGWTTRAASPSQANNSNVFIFTRLGGVQAGDTIPVVQSGAGAAMWGYFIWYDTQGYDISVVGSVGGRSGTSSTTTVIPGITTLDANQDVILVATERTLATGTTVSSITGATVTQDFFNEGAGGTTSATSGLFGHFTPASAGATGSLTITYSNGSGNGAGMLFGISTPKTNPVAIVGTPTTSDGSTAVASAALNVPTGAKVGEILLATITTGGSGMTITPPAGWNQVQTGNDGGNYNTWWVGYRVVDGTESASYTWSWTSTTYHMMTMSRMAGTNTSSPVRTSASSDNAGSATNYTGPTLSGVQSTDVEYYLFAIGEYNGTTFASAPTISAGYTASWSRVNQGKAQMLAAANTAGSQAAPTATASSTTSVYASAGFALEKYVAPTTGATRTITFDGGTEGSTVVTDSTITTVGGAITYKAAASIHGGFGADGADGTGYIRVDKPADWISANGANTGSIYVRPVTVSSGAVRVISFFDTNNNSCGYIRMNSSNQFQLSDGTNTAVATATTTWTAGNIYRLDWQYDGSVVTLKIFTSYEGTSAAETISGTTNTSSRTFGRFQITPTVGTGSANEIYIDTIRLYDGTASWPSPYANVTNPVVQDALNGDSGTAWTAANWTTVLAGTGSNVVQDRGGRLTTRSDGTYAAGDIAVSKAAAIANVDVTFDLRIGNTGEQYFFTQLRAGSDWGATVRSTTGYSFQFTPGTINTLKVYKGTDTTTALASANYTYGVGWNRVRLQIIGSTIKAKIWSSYAAEPSTWAFSFVDSSFASAGAMLWSHYNGPTAQSMSAYVKNVSVTDGTTTSNTFAALSANALLNTFTDNFSTQDTTKWYWGTGAAIVNGQLSIPVDSNYDGIVSNSYFDLTSNASYVQLVQAANVGNGTTETQFLLSAGRQDKLYFDVNGGNLKACYQQEGNDVAIASVAYNASTMQWLRMTHDGTTVFYQYSADGNNWTTLGSWAPTFWIGALQVQLYPGYYGTETSPGTAIYDNFNTGIVVSLHFTDYNGTTEVAASLTVWNGTSEVAVASTYRMPTGITVTQMANSSYQPFFVAHRGGSADWAEHSMRANTQSVYLKMDAIEISLARTSDGVWFGLHDQYLNRTSPSAPTNYDPSQHTWAEVSQYQCIAPSGGDPAFGAQPYCRLVDAIATYSKSHVMFLDPKYVSSTYWSELLDLMDANGGTNRFIAKFYGTGINWANTAGARGYSSWGYFYASDIDSGTVTSANTSPWTYLGMEYGAAASYWTTIKSYGKPVIAHIAPDYTSAQTGISQGAVGVMCSGVRSVMGYYRP